MNMANVIGKIIGVHDIEDDALTFEVTTKFTRLDKDGEVENVSTTHTCFARGRFLNTVSHLKLGAEVGIEGRLVNGARNVYGIEVNDLIIL